jgi:hypothetical protein
MTCGLITRFDDLIVSIRENFYEAMTMREPGKGTGEREEEGKRLPFSLSPLSPFAPANQVALKLAD